MCTAITLHSKKNHHVLGRTMDFSYPIAPTLYFVNKNRSWSNVKLQQSYPSKYSFLALGQTIAPLQAFFDGVNEKGIGAAALYFAGYAYYDKVQQIAVNRYPIASYDVLQYILGNCGSLAQLPSLLQELQLIGMEDPITKSVAPLHWIVSDKTGETAIIEKTKNGMQLYRNPLGIFANSPEFPWHLTNLRNYGFVTSKQEETANWGGMPLPPFGQGGNSTGLPGGFTSPQRFVRAAYLKSHLPQPVSLDETIQGAFHILQSVSIPQGAVLSNRDTYDYTKYIAVMELTAPQYFFQSYANQQITRVSLSEYWQEAAPMLELGNVIQPIQYYKIQAN